MTTRLWMLAALLLTTCGASAAETGGHHRHEEGSLPAASESCSCGKASSSQGTWKCLTWHCHPGEAEAHKAPWKPGKAVELKVKKKDALPEPTAECAEKAAPDMTSSLQSFTECQTWTEKADCSGAGPALVTRCTETLDPAFRFTRNDKKGSDCHCAEWQTTGGTNTTKSACTAWMCRPKKKG